VTRSSLTCAELLRPLVPPILLQKPLSPRWPPFLPRWNLNPPIYVSRVAGITGGGHHAPCICAASTLPEVHPQRPVSG
jgi:hypothetical protein